MTTTCPVCSSVERRPFRREDSYDIVACERCGLRYLCPQPSDEALTTLYQETYFASPDSGATGYDMYAADAENLRRTFRARLDDLQVIGHRGRLLDVGAATGIFVEQARQAGWDAHGLEPSRWAAAFARDVLRQPVTTGTLESAHLRPASYDLVTLWEVLEHVRDPRATLDRVARLLRPGGHLALSTPDAGSVAARVAGKRWPGWRKVPEHLTFFDWTNLRRLLESAGFRVVRRRYVAIDVTVNFALQRISTMLGSSRTLRVPRVIGNRSVRINPWYDLMVLARLDDESRDQGSFTA